MKFRSPLLAALTFFSVQWLSFPVFAQTAYLSDIDLELLEAGQQISITVNGVKPSPCFDIVESPQIENFMVTVRVEIRFPQGVSSCVRENSPFTVTSVIDTPPPGEYEVLVSINGKTQVQYRLFNVEETGKTIEI